MTEPLFWLGLSLLLVAVSLTAVLVAALPALQELARAARSAEKLFDTLRRELPPTLESIRLTGLEISDLTDDISSGVQNAGSVAKQVNQGLSSAKDQVQGASVNTRSVLMGVKAAWQTWQNPSRRRRSRASLRSYSTPAPHADQAGLTTSQAYGDLEAVDPEARDRITQPEQNLIENVYDPGLDPERPEN